MTSLKAIAVALGACLFAHPCAFADSQSISLDDVLVQGLRESPEVPEIDARIEAQRGSGLSLASLENPTIDGEVRVPSSYDVARGKNEVEVSLSQPLRISDFGARSGVHELIQSVADSEERLTLLHLSHRIRLAYVRTWALEEQADQFSRYITRASTLESSVRKASESGYVGAGEVHLFRAEVLKARLLSEAVRGDATRARAELSKIVGQPLEGKLLRPALPSTSGLNPQTGFPIQQRATLNHRLAQGQLRLSQLDAYPKFAPRIVFERSGDDTEYYGAGISFELPLFNRNQGEQMARRAEVAVAERQHRYLTGDDYSQEVSAMIESLKSSIQLVQGYESKIVPALRTAVQAEEQLLSSGQGSFFRVWQTLRELASAESELKERTVGVFTLYSELAALTGQDF